MSECKWEHGAMNHLRTWFTEYEDIECPICQIEQQAEQITNLQDEAEQIAEDLEDADEVIARLTEGLELALQYIELDNSIPKSKVEWVRKALKGGE